LKLGEHKLFFYNFYKNRYKCAITFDVDFIQCPKETVDYPDGIEKYRKRAWDYHNNYIVLHWKYK